MRFGFIECRCVLLKQALYDVNEMKFIYGIIFVLVFVNVGALDFLECSIYL